MTEIAGRPAYAPFTDAKNDPTDELRRQADSRGVLAPGDKRAAIVADALYTIARHACDTCAAGSWCDIIVHAHHVVTLNELFEEQSAASAASKALEEAHKNGRLEGTAQALAVIGKAEGEYRTKADGNSEHPAFTVAETHRMLATSIRAELKDPLARTALESKARSEEATELSAYVREVSEQFRKSDATVAKALDNVAGDLAKGTEGVAKLKQASDSTTPPVVLGGLVADIDPDVRWWAAQNASTPVRALIDAAEGERHPTILTALLTNKSLPVEHVKPFATHANADVAAAAQRRLAVE